MPGDKKHIGYFGVPAPELILKYKKDHAPEQFIDLDVPGPEAENTEVPFLMDTYCRIIQNIIRNALFYRDSLEVVLASTGPEKCDAGRVTAHLLSDLGFTVISGNYPENSPAVETPISTSGLPLVQKVTRIMDSIVTPHDSGDLPPVPPTHGFWGVPPNDLEILKIFPDTTHVFGWTRCVEAHRPHEMNLEMQVPETIPVVFFSQTFCHKQLQARYLAKKHDGLFVEVHGRATNSTLAKIEAFLDLRT